MKIPKILKPLSIVLGEFCFYQKLFLCVLSAAVIITSCHNQTPTIKQAPSVDDVVEFTYNEHDYIMFYYNSDGAHNSRTGVVHSPDCKKCKEDENNRDVVR